MFIPAQGQSNLEPQIPKNFSKKIDKAIKNIQIFQDKIIEANSLEETIPKMKSLVEIEAGVLKTQNSLGKIDDHLKELQHQKGQQLFNLKHLDSVDVSHDTERQKLKEEAYIKEKNILEAVEQQIQELEKIKNTSQFGSVDSMITTALIKVRDSITQLEGDVDLMFPGIQKLFSQNVSNDFKIMFVEFLKQVPENEKESLIEQASLFRYLSNRSLNSYFLHTFFNLPRTERDEIIGHVKLINNRRQFKSRYFCQSCRPSTREKSKLIPRWTKTKIIFRKSE